MAKHCTEAASAHRELSYNGSVIARPADGMISLNDMWKAAGEPANKDPRQWIRKPAIKELVEVMAVNVEKSHIIRSGRGRHGGTLAVVNLAIAYAKYLSPEFHAWANQVIVERMEEEADPELGIVRSRQRAVRSFQRQGKSQQWIQKRLEIIDTRNHFTDTLQAHGVHDFGFAHCTNAIYKPTLGGSAKEVKVQRGLAAGQNLRDHLDIVELAAIGLSEALADEAIRKHKFYGRDQCELVCWASGGAVASAVTSVRSIQ